MLRKERSTTPAAAPAPRNPERVYLRCEDLGETRDFDPAHAARILAVQERQQLSGDSTWQPAAAPDSSASA